MDLVREFHDRDAELKNKDKNGMKPLHVACSSPCPATVLITALLHTGTCVTATTKRIETGLNLIVLNHRRIYFHPRALPMILPYI
jgi:hypothetical protein